MKEYQLPISIWPSKQTHTYCIDATSNQEKQRNLHPNHQPPSSIHPSTYIVALTRLLSTYIPTCGSRNPWCYSGENNPNKKRQPHPHAVAKLWSPCIFSLVFLKSPQKHSKRNKVTRYPNQCSYPPCLSTGWMEKKNIKCIPSPGSRQWGVGPRCNRPPARCRRVPQPWARAQAAAPDLGWQQRRPAQGGQRRRRGRGWHQPPGGARTWGEGRGNGRGDVFLGWEFCPEKVPRTLSPTSVTCVLDG